MNGSAIVDLHRLITGAAPPLNKPAPTTRVAPFDFQRPPKRAKPKSNRVGRKPRIPMETVVRVRALWALNTPARVIASITGMNWNTCRNIGAGAVRNRVSGPCDADIVEAAAELARWVIASPERSARG